MGKSANAAIPSLIPLLKDNDKNVRFSAILTLANMGELAKAAIPSLIPLLKDDSVRSFAAIALGSMGESAKAAIPSLIPLLKDANEVVRFLAADALGKMGESAIPNLIPLLKDEDELVRGYAAEALEKLGYKPSSATPAKVATPSLTPLPQLSQGSVANAQSEEFVRQIFVQELKNIQLPDRAVDYWVMLKSDGSITQIFPMGASAEQLLPRLKIVIGSPVKGKLPLPANANAVPRAFRVFITSDEVRVFIQNHY